ncbi:MAG: phytanoyl-CoA dioxygenase family protein [Planctomycetota bacterium]|nr:phytanoyl-CoA dioxygenase family protein [Planctomycetota bacterium]
MKQAGHGNEVPWHQDTSYWGQEKRMTCWLAIDDATPENGCMRMIPGSHRKGQLKFTPTRFEGVGQDLLRADEVNEDTQVYVPVRAGCASFHHPLTLHASSPNRSGKSRRALAITYLAGA